MVRLSVRPSTDSTCPSNGPPATRPFAVVRSRSSVEPGTGATRSEATSRSSAPSRTKCGTSFEIPPTHTLPRRSTSGCGALRRDLARDLARPVRRDAAADAGIGSREIDDVEGLDQQRRAVGQDAGGNPPRRRALARADAARIQDEADIDLLGRLEDAGQLRQVVEIQALDRDLRLDLAALVGFRRRVADIAGQGRLAGLQPQAVEGQDGVRKGDFRGGLDGAPVEHPSGEAS